MIIKMFLQKIFLITAYELKSGIKDFVVIND